MSNEAGEQTPGAHTGPVHSLIPLADFKAILGLDDRDTVLGRFCLATATYAIEQYCRRRLYLKRYHERIEFHGDSIMPLLEYPVRELLALYAE
ncbi:MAG: hypothetical protein LBP20_05940 [Treponema sp.]|jgi:hypothetical protein|nr:hypothetical protein [Treponema sp.]